MGEAAKQNIDPYIIMDNAANAVPPGSNGVIYLPYLMGERTPHLDPDARGVFFGLSAKHTRFDMLRSVMEGVSYSLLDCLNIIAEMGVSATEVCAGGGGGKSKLWRQMQADMFGCGMTTNTSTEGGALGVALLAGVGTGAYKTVEEACAATIKVVDKTLPNPQNAEIYKKYYQIYKDVYVSLKEQFKKL
jgi:xylulokinase